MPHTAPSKWAQEALRLNRTWKCISGLWWLHNVLFYFALYLFLFLPSWLLLYIDFIAFSFSVSPTIGCIQHSTPQNMYVAEKQPQCPPRPPLSRSAILPLSSTSIVSARDAWVLSEHAPALIFDGRRFTLNRRMDNGVRCWRCTKRTSPARMLESPLKGMISNSKLHHTQSCCGCLLIIYYL